MKRLVVAALLVMVMTTVAYAETRTAGPGPFGRAKALEHGTIMPFEHGSIWPW